MKKTGNIRKC